MANKDPPPWSDGPCARGAQVSTRRDVLRAGSAALAAAPLFHAADAMGAASGSGYDPSMSVTLSPEELASHRNPALLKHLVRNPAALRPTAVTMTT